MILRIIIRFFICAMTFIRLLTYASITGTSIQIQQTLSHLHIYTQPNVRKLCLWCYDKNLFITIGDINLDLQRSSKLIINIAIFIFDILSLQLANEYRTVPKMVQLINRC